MKKLMTSTIIVLPLIILAIMLVSGAILSMVTHIYVEGVELVSNEDLVLVMDDEAHPPTYDLGKEVTILPLKATNRDLVYASEDDSVVTVDENGKICAVFYGETFVEVKSKENQAATAKRKVLVTDNFVHKIEIKQDFSAQMYEGSIQQISVNIYPKEAKNKMLTWKSSDESVFQVNDNGVVTAVGAGTARLTAISQDNQDISDSVEITCYPRVRSLEFDRASVLTSASEALFPQVEINPDALGVTLSYSSDNESVATVNDKGEITFHKAGYVVITVKATDFGQNYVQAKKDYTSTFGYFIGPLFEQKEYEFDYDEFENKPLPIQIMASPSGAYRLIEDVSFTIPGVLSFDKENDKFSLIGPMPKGRNFVDVTVLATLYDVENKQTTEHNEDTFRVYIYRNALAVTTSYNGTPTSEIQTAQQSLTFTEDGIESSSTINILVDPENHTNDISFELIEGREVANLNGKTLTFSQAGVAKVKISLCSEDGIEHASKEISINYAPIEKGDKAISFDADGETKTEVEVSLNVTDASDKDTGVIYFTTPDEAKVTYKVAEGDEVIKLLQPDENHLNWRIEAIKGGFASVQIVADMPDKTQKTWTIPVYVNYALTNDDFEIKINDQEVIQYRTSLGSINISLSADNSHGALEGKEIYLRANGQEYKVDNFEEFEKEIEFVGDSLEIFFEARFKVGVKEEYSISQDFGLISLTRSASTTRGYLDKEPTVKFDGGTLTTQEENVITFSDIGQSVQLTIEGEFSPADFDIKTNRPDIKSIPSVTASVSSDGKIITLTSEDAAKGQKMTLSIGGKTFALKTDVYAKANCLTVSCDDTLLTKDDTYSTILNNLLFRVVADRQDGKPIDDKRIEYSFDNLEWTEAQTERDVVSIDLTKLTDYIYFRSKDQGANVKFKLNKIDLQDFGMTLTCSTTDGMKTIGEVKSVAANKDLNYRVPSKISGPVTLQLGIEQDLLGGLGNDNTFSQLFSIDLSSAQGWSDKYDAKNGQITISFAEGERQFQNKAFTLKYKDISATITLSLIELDKIEFVGFDSTNQEHQYLGYQQVRVFAKHSDYGGKNGVGQVDYFKIPYKAQANLSDNAQVSADALVWKLTRFVGDQEIETIATQNGRNVTIGDKQYTIVQLEDGSNVLQDDKGNTVSGQGGKNTEYVWVDAFTEQGYARIYFGNFSGLLESDIQNDYFGNFDEKDAWSYAKPAVETVSGRDYSTHDGHSFAFLRVEAGDGANGGQNCHFNFNVLDDPDGEQLFNVFNATGYYAHSNVVLHENLYGPGELDDQASADGETLSPKQRAENEDLFLTNKDGLGKTLIYGNGYQVNLQAYNEYIIEDIKNNPSSYKSGFNESKGVTLSRAYNAVIKGANPSETLNGKTQTVVLKMDSAYYCELSYYYKFNPPNTIFYAKNTVFSYVAKAGIQLYTKGQSLFVENIAMIECGTGVLLDDTKNGGQDVKIYFKGSSDILNFSNKTTLNNLNPLVGLLYGYIVPGVGQYFEWQGKTQTTSVGSTKDNLFYVNVLTFGLSDLSEKTFVWDGSDYKKVSDGVALPNGSKIVHRPLGSVAGMSLYALTYEILNDEGIRLDNGQVDIDLYPKGKETDPDMAKSVTGMADLSKLFTKDRYIRLQCEYKEDGVKNYDHILWHKQQVYRDLTAEKFRDRETDHAEHLKSTLVGQNITWPDGSTPEQAVEAEEQAKTAMNINRALSTVVFPAKKKIS